MILYDLSFDDPATNILCDEFLYERVNQGACDECLRIWESPSVFIVLGRVSSFDEDVCAETVKHDKIPVLRRCSGGGTVLQGPGCLNFSFILSKEKRPQLKDLHASYQVILEPLLEGLRACGIDAQFFPLSDLALGEEKKKFSGNAQRRGRKAILHHGTILYNYDLALVKRYLKIPTKMPEYRQERNHGAFLANVPVSKEKVLSACFEPCVDDAGWQRKFPHEMIKMFDAYCAKKKDSVGQISL